MLLDKSIHIHAAPDRVYAWLSPVRQPSWDKSLVRVAPRSTGPLHAGSVFDRVSRALGHRFESATEAVEVEEGRRFGWRQIDGDFEEHRGWYFLEPEGDGTRVRLVADVEFPFVLPRLATETELRRSVSRAADDALFNLKALSEGGDRGA